MDDRKLNVLLVLEALKKYTNSDKYLSQTELTKKVNSLYHIELDRKTVREHLIALETMSSQDLDDKLPFRVKKNHAGSYALERGQFEVYEVNFLIDAILSSKYLNADDATDLAQKIISFLSDEQQKIYRNVIRVHRIDQINRTKSNETLATIEEIYKAIKDKNQLMFLYQTYDFEGNLTVRNNGSYIQVNPYKVIVRKGDYYLLANVKDSKSLTSFRVDYMEDTQELEEDRLEIENLPGYEKGFNVTKYINEHIYFTDGDVVDAKILITNSDALRYIYDWFGKTAKITKTKDGFVASLKCDENALYYWCMQYAEHIQVLKPESLVKRMFNTACSIQLNMLNQIAKNKEIKLNLQGIYSKYVLVSALESYKYNELRIRDLWNSVLDSDAYEVNYLHRVTYCNIGKLKDRELDVIRSFKGSHDFVLLLLLTKQIIEFAESIGIDILSDGLVERPISNIKEKFYKARIKISDNTQDDEQIEELCIDNLIKLSNKNDQMELGMVMDCFSRLIRGYFDQTGSRKETIKKLFLKATNGYGFTLLDAETSEQLNFVRKEAGLMDENISFKEIKRKKYEY